MLKAQARDFRGVERIDVEVEPIALVGGRNGSGKTSFAQAIGCVLSGATLPVRGFDKGAAGELVRAGKSMGAAVVQSDTGTGRTDWPECSRRTDGKPPEASHYAAGLVSIVDPQVDRAVVLSDYLHARPTREDLALALADQPGFGAGVTDALWELIEARGFDGAHQARRDAGASNKGEWRRVTGQNYGSRVAASFRPELAEERRTKEELADLVNRARAIFEAALSASAVSGANRERLENESKSLTERAAAVTAAEAAVEEAQRAVQVALDERAACLPAETEQGLPCPHCGAFVVLRRPNLVETHLEKAPTNQLDDKELKTRRNAIAGADGELSRRRGELGTATRLLGEARAALQASTAARDALETSAGNSPAGDVDHARAAVAAAERVLADTTMKREADKIHEAIEANEVLLELLAPEGLRQTKLLRVLELFNSRLEEIAKAAGWRPVIIRPTLAIAYGDRPYPLCSASEQFRARVILQIGMAQIDGADLVVIDGADILDAGARRQLFELLLAARIPAIVTMTMAGPERVPDLASAGWGRSYWLEAGIATPIERPREAAA